MDTIKSSPDIRKPKTPLEALKSKVVNLPTNIVSPILIIASVTVIYIFSVGADILVLLLINLSCGDAVYQNSLAKTILNLIKLFSSLGTLAAFMMTLIILLFLYRRDFLKISWGTKENVSLKNKVMKCLEDTGTLILDVVGVTFIFSVLIGAIALALLV